MRSRIIYRHYENLIYRNAHGWHNIFPSSDLSDLIAEGNLAFCEAKKSYNPERGSFSTYLTNCLNRKLHYLITKGKSMINNDNKKRAEYTYSVRGSGEEFDEMMSPLEVSNANSPERFLSTFGSMSESAFDIVKLLANAPQELIDMIPASSIGLRKNIIKKYLKKQGWKGEKISVCFKEIEQTLAEC